jgi:predicted HTH transcriptional regulator
MIFVKAANGVGNLRAQSLDEATPKPPPNFRDEIHRFRAFVRRKKFNLRKRQADKRRNFNSRAFGKKTSSFVHLQSVNNANAGFPNDNRHFSFKFVAQTPVIAAFFGFKKF